MDLIDDVDLVARGIRLVVRAVDQIANVVDAGMGGSVHLDHIEMPAFQDGAAVNALLRDIDRRALAVRPLIVQRTGHEARGGRLPDAPHAGEHIGLGDPSRREGIPQGADHRLLADEFSEHLRPVFARERRVAHRRVMDWVFGLVFGHREVFGHCENDTHAMASNGADPGTKGSGNATPAEFTRRMGKVGGWTINPRNAR